MKTATFLTFLLASGALAWPGLKNILTDLETKLSTRSALDTRQDGVFGDDSLELLGDLRPEKGGPNSPTGWTVWGILTSSTEPQGFTE